MEVAPFPSEEEELCGIIVLIKLRLNKTCGDRDLMVSIMVVYTIERTCLNCVQELTVSKGKIHMIMNKNIIFIIRLRKMRM